MQSIFQQVTGYVGNASAVVSLSGLGGTRVPYLLKSAKFYKILSVLTKITLTILWLCFSVDTMLYDIVVNNKPRGGE